MPAIDFWSSLLRDQRVLFSSSASPINTLSWKLKHFLTAEEDGRYEIYKMNHKYNLVDPIRGVNKEKKTVRN